MKFSERYGYTPVKDIIQFESMDNDLKNGLWSLLDRLYWSNERIRYDYLSSLFEKLWFSFFKLPTDEIPANLVAIRKLRIAFFKFKWFQIYDFIEFIAKEFIASWVNERFIKTCNELFERENGGYRFIDDKITPITDKKEIDEIQHSLDEGSTPVKNHLSRALELLSDKTNPDYRNSIKESVSALESFVKQTLDNPNGGMGQLLKELQGKSNIHPAQKDAFSKLYGYTSDAHGIRHAMLEESNLDFYDAKFMLVACSTFINFIKGKLG